MAPSQPFMKARILTCGEYFGICLGEFTSFQLEISLFWDEGPGDTYMGEMQKGLVAAFAVARSTIKAH